MRAVFGILTCAFAFKTTMANTFETVLRGQLSKDGKQVRQDDLASLKGCPEYLTGRFDLP